MIPTWPATITFSPTRVLPEMARCAAMMECFPIMTFVRDLHEIVDLNAFLDPVRPNLSAINGCVCPDLNIVVKSGQFRVAEFFR